MVQASLRNNPLLAALLGTVVTGLGHLYLRRWLRAIGWLGAMVLVSILFVPNSTVSAINSWTVIDPLSVLPIVLISVASVLDAYFIAKTTRMQADEVRTDNAIGTTEKDESPACPACGKPVNPDLGFCHWCTTEFDIVDISELQGLDETNSN